MNNRTNGLIAAVPLAVALITGATTTDSIPSPVAPTAIVDQGVRQLPASMGQFAGDDRHLSICSFNIQFLGSFKARDNAALVSILQDFDVIVIQELVAPPYPGTFPDGTPYKPQPRSQEFFDLMQSVGFEFVLSEEDTGKSTKNHNNGAATEWWVAFYDPDRVQPDEDIPHGFLADDRTKHPNFDRVPYAFGFETTDGLLDFVLVSVHLRPGTGPANRARRQEELATVATWIDQNDDAEKDFIILGDMNIYTASELAAATPDGFESLNDSVVETNTNVRNGLPYDHVMIDPIFSTEVDGAFDFKVVNLREQMQPFWDSSNGAYPGSPYHHDKFRVRYSDHHPVVFRMTIPDADDD